jgi:four helix bundle protein
MGSASETEYHLLLARDLGFLADEDYNSLNLQIQEIKRMLASLMAKVRADAKV